jgi:hypothetical protein
VDAIRTAAPNPAHKIISRNQMRVKNKNNADQYLLTGFAMEQDVSPCEMD